MDAANNVECCGCTSYRTGSLIICILTLIASVGSIISGSIVLDDCLYSYTSNYHYKNVCYYYGYSSVISGSMILIGCLLLFAGIKQNNQHMMVLFPVLMFVNTLSYFIMASKMFSNEYVAYGISALTAAVIDSWFAIIILKHIKWLSSEQTRQMIAARTGGMIGQNPPYPGQMGYPAPYPPMTAPAPYPSNFTGYGVQNNGFAPDPMMGQNQYATNPMNSNGSPYPSGPNVGSYPAPPPYSPHPETNSLQQLPNSSNPPNLTNPTTQPSSTSNSNQPSAPDFGSVSNSSLSNNENQDKY